MQFEVGKKYVDRNNEVYTFIAERNHEHFPLLFIKHALNEPVVSKTKEGRHYTKATSKYTGVMHHTDIVAEYKEPKKFTLTLIRNKQTNKTFFISLNSFTLFSHEEIVGTLEISEEDFKKE